jgi:hypothetical protein
VFVVASAAVAAGSFGAASASCTYGSYDGSFDSAGLEISTEGQAGDGGGVVASRSVPPDQDMVVSTPDGVFDITILKGTFSAAVTVTITQLPERTLQANQLIVPVYAVTAGAEAPKQPVQVTFRGNASNGKQGGLGPALQRAGGQWEFLAVVGADYQSGGQSQPFWGLTKELGVFSLKASLGTPSPTFFETKGGCMAGCGQNAGNPNGYTAGVVDKSCFCAGSTAPDPSHFIPACADLEAAKARCATLDATESSSLPCHPATCDNCGGPNTCNQQVCCAQKAGNQCISAGNACGGFVIRCTADTDCKSGRHCCAVGQETLCVEEACGGSQRVCTNAGDCADAGVDAGDSICVPSPTCPIRTCGALPAGCQ